MRGVSDSQRTAVLTKINAFSKPGPSIKLRRARMAEATTEIPKSRAAAVSADAKSTLVVAGLSEHDLQHLLNMTGEWERARCDSGCL